MKKNKKVSGKKKRSNLVFKILSLILLLSAICATVFIIRFDILPTMYLSLFIVGGGLIIFILFKILNNKRLKKWIRVIVSIPSFILSIGFILISLYSVGTLSFLNDILDVGIRTDSYSVYVINDSKYESINDLSDEIIGMSDKSDDGMKKAIDKVAKKIEYRMAEFDNTAGCLEALENSEVEGILSLDSNIDLLKEDTDEYDNIKPIYTFTISTKVETMASKVDVSKENFVFYISGIDTNGKVAAKARSDVNIIIAVNPSKNKILMVNTPRDYFVKLHTKQAMDKLTHAGVYGIEESVGTLEDLYNINIDYYARVNFTTFTKIVEALDGITVNVPVSFCEQTSSRTSSKQICLKSGEQDLTGEEALALARTRHTLSGGDRARIENQLLVLRAIMDKAMSPSIIVKYNSLLSSVSDSVVTNMDQKTITKLVKKQIKKNDSWDIETFTVDGSDSSSTTYSTGSARAYVMKPNEETVLEAKQKLDTLLETKKYTTTTTKKTTTKK